MSPKRSVALPFAFGQVVYHRAKEDRVAGIVTSYTVYESGIKVNVVWGDDLRVGGHFFYELTTEFEAFQKEGNPDG